MASSKASRFAVWVILGLLIVGLAGFGATGLSGNIRTIGKVGEKDITAESYARALQQELRALTAQTGRAVSFSEAQAAGDRPAGAGPAGGDARARPCHRRGGAFRGRRGAARPACLDPGVPGARRAVQPRDLRARAAAIGAHRGRVRGAAARGAGARTAPVRGDRRHRGTSGPRRDACRLPCPAAATSPGRSCPRACWTPPLPEPDEAALRAQWDSDPDAYTLLAAKRITYAWMRPSMLLDTVEVEEEAIRALYEDRRAGVRARGAPARGTPRLRLRRRDRRGNRARQGRSGGVRRTCRGNAA